MYEYAMDIVSIKRRNEAIETELHVHDVLTEGNEELEVEQCELDEVTQHQRQHHDKRTWRHNAAYTHA